VPLCEAGKGFWASAPTRAWPMTSRVTAVFAEEGGSLEALDWVSQ
jgi:hypothetical protein